MNDSNTALGLYVRRVRKNKGMTLQQVADAAKLTKGLISRIENGGGNPCMTTLVPLAKALELKVYFGELWC